MSEPTQPTEYEWMRRAAPEQISLRDYFAALALQGILANPTAEELSFEACAMDAYQHADAMLQARKGGG